MPSRLDLTLRLYRIAMLVFGSLAIIAFALAIVARFG